LLEIGTATGRDVLHRSVKVEAGQVPGEHSGRVGVLLRDHWSPAWLPAQRCGDGDLAATEESRLDRGVGTAQLCDPAACHA
jgi:hypothetical protein